MPTTTVVTYAPSRVLVPDAVRWRYDGCLARRHSEPGQLQFITSRAFGPRKPFTSTLLRGAFVRS